MINGLDKVLSIVNTVLNEDLVLEDCGQYCEQLASYYVVLPRSKFMDMCDLMSVIYTENIELCQRVFSAGSDAEVLQLCRTFSKGVPYTERLIKLYKGVDNIIGSSVGEPAHDVFSSMNGIESGFASNEDSEVTPSVKDEFTSNDDFSDDDFSGEENPSEIYEEEDPVRIQELEDEVAYLKRQLEDKNREIDLSKSQTQQLKDRLTFLDSECVKLQTISNQLNQQVQDLSVYAEPFRGLTVDPSDIRELQQVLMQYPVELSRDIILSIITSKNKDKSVELYALKCIDAILELGVDVQNG